MRIIFISLLISCNIYANDFINEIHSSFDKFNENPVIKIEYYKQSPETSEEAEARSEREAEDRKAVALNKAETRDQRYWINGEWVSAKYKIAKTKSELKDSDNDGYDDYTEFKNGTDPNNSSIFPAIREGNNKKIFK